MLRFGSASGTTLKIAVYRHHFASVDPVIFQNIYNGKPVNTNLTICFDNAG